jgi:hypothetical protein
MSTDAAAQAFSVAVFLHGRDTAYIAGVYAHVFPLQTVRVLDLIAPRGFDCWVTMLFVIALSAHAL